MGASDLALLVGSALLAGALNAVAGGGSLLTFPALVLAGLDPIAANATSTVALWPGSVGSAVAYRAELDLRSSSTRLLLALSLAGGVAGAWLLVRTPPAVFTALLPFLLLWATLSFALGERLRRGGGGHGQRRWAGLLLLPIAVYGGYFGGGMGLLMLGAFAVMGMTDVSRMNALKAVLATLLNAAAIVTFLFAGLVSWKAAGLMAGGALAGGYAGAALARRIAPRYLRVFVVAVGAALTLVFAWRAWG